MEKRVEAMNREQPFDTDEQQCMLKIQREVRGTRLKPILQVVVEHRPVLVPVPQRQGGAPQQ